MKKSLLFLIMIVAMVLAPVTFAAAEQPSSQVEVLTLDKCLDIAYKNSKQLQSAAKSVEIAKETLHQAESGLWPTIGYTVAAMQYQEATAKTSMSTEGSYAGITATQYLYTGGMTTANIKIAKIGLESALENQRKTKQTLTYNVKSAYYQAWLSIQLVKVAQASYDNLGHHEQQMRNFYQAGTKSRFDLLQAQVQHESLKPNLIKAQNGLALANLNLATTIGIEKNRKFIVGDDPSKALIPEKAEFALQDLLEEAYRDRPEIRQLKLVNEIDKAQVKLAYAGYKPKVSLTAGLGGQSLGYLTTYDTNWPMDWSLILSINGNFFDGFKTPAAVSQAKDTVEKAQLDESYQRDLLGLDVQQAIQDINGDLETITSSKSQIDLAKESLRLTQARSDAGMATTMDIMDAELALDNASNVYYTNVSAYLTAMAKLDLSLGKDNQ